MPKYILRSTDSLSAPARVPDMRGLPKKHIHVLAETLNRIWGLPEPVAVRALVRVNDVTFVGGDVVIDDEAVVLHPVMRFRREVVPEALTWVE